MVMAFGVPSFRDFTATAEISFREVFGGTCSSNMIGNSP